jgi:hypothetical protein
MIVKKLNLKNTNMNILQFIQFAIDNLGGSYNFITGDHNPEKGYMVSIEGHGRVSGILTEEGVKEFCRENADFLLSDDVYLGLWYSEGVWHYDLSINVQGLGKAVQAGLLNNQLAIWDCENNREIQL